MMARKEICDECGKEIGKVSGYLSYQDYRFFKLKNINLDFCSFTCLKKLLKKEGII